MKKTVFLLFLLFLFLVLPFPSVFAEGWVSPTGFEESVWSYEERAYDDDLEIDSYYHGNGWSPYLVLTIDQIYSTKIRFWISEYYPWNGFLWGNLQVDVYKDGEWVNVFDKPWSTGWNEAEFTQGPVTKARYRIWCNYPVYCRCYEFDFWEVEEAPPTQYELNLNSLPFQNVNFTLNGTIYQTNYTDTLNQSYYNISFPSTWINNSITYVFKNWSDGLTNPSRIINLNANTTLTVTYILPPPTPEAHILFVGASVVFGLIAFVFILSRRKKQ